MAYARRLQQLFRFMCWGGIAAAAITAVLAPWLVTILLGPSYTAAIPVLRTHAVTNIFVFLGVAQSIAIVNDRKPQVALIKTLSGVIASVSANLVLIPMWGALGAAIAAIFSYLCSAVLANAIVDRPILMMQVKAFWPFHARRR
jgi:O-antigen/teichoic acid export membrane protein